MNVLRYYTTSVAVMLLAVIYNARLVSGQRDTDKEFYIAKINSFNQPYIQ